MKTDKRNSLSDSYIDKECCEKEVAHFINGNFYGKINMEMSTKSLPKFPVKLTKKNLRKYRK